MDTLYFNAHVHIYNTYTHTHTSKGNLKLYDTG